MDRQVCKPLVNNVLYLQSLNFKSPSSQAPTWHELASTLGITAHGSARAAFFGVAQASVLFAGPLVLHALDALERSKPRMGASPFANRTKLQVLRDLVVAPLSEELVFRASLPVFLTAMCPGLKKPASFVVSIVTFSAAHCHHVFEHLRHGGYGLRTALGATAFQALYTGVFGAYASLLLHHTRNIMAPVAAHTFCNWQGIPAFDRLGRHRRSTMLWFATGLGVVGWATLVGRQASTMASTA